MTRSLLTSVNCGRRGRRRVSVVPTLVTLLIVAAVVASASASIAAGRDGAAHAARALKGTATAHLSLVEPNGSELTESGKVSGALTGTMRAVIHTGAVFAGSFAIHTHAGSIRGYGTAKPSAESRGTRYESFRGTLVIKGGSGRYIHARGTAGLYGVYDRRYESLVVETTVGTLTY